MHAAWKIAASGRLRHTNYSKALTVRGLFSFTLFRSVMTKTKTKTKECTKISNHVLCTAYWLDLSGFLHFWWLVPWCSRILISIWYFLQLSVGWWQNNLFARTLRSRSDFLTREDFQPEDSSGESFGWEPLFALPPPLTTFPKWISHNTFALYSYLGGSIFKCLHDGSFFWFYFSTVCVFKCLLKWPASEDA